MTKWEKLNLKIQILNIAFEGERHYRILHDEYVPVLYMSDKSVEYPRAYGLKNIDEYISVTFKTLPSKRDNVVDNFLKEEVF